MKYLGIILIPLLLYAGKKEETFEFGLDVDIEPKELYETFTPHEMEFLQENGFFARKSSHKKFSDLYKSLKDRNLPIYVTTDCVLHTYHILYDYSLRILEMKYLYSEVIGLTGTMIKETKKLLKDAKEDYKKELLANLAYFEIAAKLLNPDYVLSNEVENIVNEELKLIQNAAGLASSPIFGYVEDYSQYKPRGHYTRNELLQKYFRTMMWYGRMTFRLKPEKGEENKKGREETKRALLILEAAKEHIEEWEKISSPIIFYVGKSDDLTLPEYLKIKLYTFPGEEAIDVALDNTKLEKFIEVALNYRMPRILSGLAWDIQEVGVVTKGLRFFGQKFIPDSYIFQNLTYDKVGTRKKPRLFPKGLDVFAVLGSKRAQEILTVKYQQNQFLNYTSQMNELIAEFKDIKEEDWFFNLYWGWLYTLKSLLLPVPRFQPAYQDKCLQTSLGSWAELRHDTILYAKQSYTVGITSIKPKPELARGYVEPIPECYKRLKKLVVMSKTELAENAYLDDNVKFKFEQFSKLLGELIRIAENEINIKPLTDYDYRFIQGIGDALENIGSFPGTDYTTVTDESAALIADVHTDPNTEQVLQVGNDVPALIYRIIDIKNKPHIFVGGIYDYYEFLQPIGQRLTDEEWQRLSPKPNKPNWIEFFVK